LNFYKIAGLVISCEDCLDDESKRQLSFYEIEPTEQADIRFTFHFNCTGLVEPEGTLAAHIHGRRWYHLPNGGYAFVDQADQISPEILNLMIADKDFCHVEAWFCPTELMRIKNEDRRPYNLIGEVLKYAVLCRGGLLIHASSLAYQGKGILFSAPSGTGKSTHTGLWKKYAPETVIVNDDMPIVRMDNGTPLLCGAPWSGKNSIHTNLNVPLCAIVFLERGTTNTLTPMEPMEAVFRIYDAVRKPVISDLAAASLERIDELLQKVPVYTLSCDISEEAVRVAMKALE